MLKISWVDNVSYFNIVYYTDEVGNKTKTNNKIKLIIRGRKILTNVILTNVSNKQLNN